jgi:hypothetical protein
MSKLMAQLRKTYSGSLDKIRLASGNGKGKAKTLTYFVKVAE